MKLKKTVKFSLSNYKIPLLIYYGILCACVIAGIILTLSDTEHGTKIGGLETTTVIFLFVTGVSSFRSELYLYLQNGISRKTACLTYFISIAVVTAFMAFIESIAYSIIGRSTKYQTAFQQVYKGLPDRSFISVLFISFVWSFCLYFAASMIGYFVAALYYRMNKALKLIVSIGVPGTILFILPVMDQYVFNGAILHFFNKFALWIMGVNTATYHPVNWMIFCLFLALIFEGFSYLLIKKAMIKNN